MCMVTRKHFITIKIFPGRDNRGKGKGTRVSCCSSFPPSGAAHAVIDAVPNEKWIYLTRLWRIWKTSFHALVSLAIEHYQ